MESARLKGVGELLQVDLSFLLLASKTLEFLNPELRRLSLADIASDIRTTMLDELDFTKVPWQSCQLEMYHYTKLPSASEAVCRGLAYAHL